MDVPVAGTRLSDITIESMRTAFASGAETPPGGVDPAVLVDLGRAVHVPFYVRTDSGEPHAPDRTPESRQDVAEGGADRARAACRPTVERPGDRHPAAPAPRLVRTRPRDHPHSPAAGLRSDELIRANVGDVCRTKDGAVIHVRVKRGKDREIPGEAPLVQVLDNYLDTRLARFPAAAKRRSPTAGLAA